jgi:hypothetical protein
VVGTLTDARPLFSSHVVPQPPRISDFILSGAELERSDLQSRGAISIYADRTIIMTRDRYTLWLESADRKLNDQILGSGLTLTEAAKFMCAAGGIHH